MFNLLKQTNYKLLTFVIFPLVLSGCLASLSKQYEDGKAATISVIKTTNDIFDENSGGTNNKQTNSTPQQQTAAQNKPIQAKKNNSTGQIPSKNKGKKNPNYSYITLKSPAPESLASVEYRAYKGKYLKAPSRLIPTISYHQLLSMNDAKKSLNKEKIKKKFNGKGFNSMTMADIVDQSWFAFLSNVGPKTLTYSSYKKYMCNDEMLKTTLNSSTTVNQCEEAYSKSNGRSGRVSFVGGKGSVFDKKRALNGYLDNEVDKLLKLASKASHEIYVQGRLRVSSYQFEHGGFILQAIYPINFNSGHKQTTRDALWEKYPIFKSKRYGSFKKGGAGSGQLYKMSESKAEKFSEKLKKSNRQLYYVYKVRLKPTKESYHYKTRVYNVNKMKYDYDILSSEFEFFFDEAMTNKAFDLPVR